MRFKGLSDYVVLKVLWTCCSTGLDSIFNGMFFCERNVHAKWNQKKNVNKKQSASQPSKSDSAGASQINYRWVIVFHWSIVDSSPFKIVPRTFFNEEEIPDSWFSSGLGYNKRSKRIVVNCFDDGEYSVFCKVEDGRCR